MAKTMTIGELCRNNQDILGGYAALVFCGMIFFVCTMTGHIKTHGKDPDTLSAYEVLMPLGTTILALYCFGVLLLFHATGDFDGSCVFRWLFTPIGKGYH
jgi:hypothetical protein